MFWKQYVVETRWSFDHSNTEFCTFAFEGEDDFSRLFTLEGAPEYQSSTLMKMIQQVCVTQNGNPMALDNCKPVAVYLVVGPNRPYPDTGLPEMRDNGPSQKLLTFQLELVGKFDQEGRPMVNVPDEMQDVINPTPC